MDNPSHLSLGSLLKAVKRHWFAASCAALLLFCAGVLTTLRVDRKYTSTATVLLAPAADQLVAQTSGQAPPMTDPFFVRSESDIAAGDGPARDVIQRLNLVGVAEFAPQPGWRGWFGLPRRGADSGLSDEQIAADDVLKKYQDALSVQNDGRSNTLAIAFTSTSPKLAAEIANAHAEAYLSELASRRMALEQKAIEWLQHEVETREQEVREADARVQQYQLDSGIVSANDSTLVDQRLAQLNSQLIDARRQLSAQTTLLDEVRRIRKGGEPDGASGLSTDTALTGLLQNRASAEANIAALEKRFAPGHPTLVREREVLAGINNTLSVQLARVESEAASSASWLRNQVAEINAAVTAETGRKVGQDRVAVGLPALQSQAQVKRAVFETVLGRYQTLLAERAFATPTASIVERAVPSSRPSFPKVPLFLAISGMVALLGGAAAAAAFERRSAASMGLTEMADAVGIQPLVAIPRVRRSSRFDGDARMQDPRLFVESIRFLREAVLAGRQSERGKICLVTSVLPRQGKSLVAMSLARALARAKRRTLFLELDLRRPTGSLLARRPPPEDGVAAVLEGRTRVLESVVRDCNPKLDLLLAEDDACRVLDRLTSDTLSELLAELRSHYDAIVIDSPPLGLVSDALTLTPLVDQILLVAKDADSSLGELRRGSRLLRERGAVVPGLVLTSVDPAQLSSVDKKTLHHYIVGIPEIDLTELAHLTGPRPGRGAPM